MNDYGPDKYLPMRGPSIATLMKRVLAIKWAKDQQPSPLVKFTVTIAAKVEGKRA